MFSNEAAITRLVGAILLEQNDEWAFQRARYENRERPLLRIVRKIRDRCGPDFPISVKLNSSDFQQGGFSNADCLQVVLWFEQAGVDHLEISGGNYEAPSMVGSRTSEGTALKSDALDMIELGWPMCIETDAPNRLLAGADACGAYEKDLAPAKAGLVIPDLSQQSTKGFELATSTKQACPELPAKETLNK